MAEPDPLDRGGAVRPHLHPSPVGSVSYLSHLQQQLRAWLPQGRRVLLIGDRGFGGRDRVRFLKEQGFQYLLRVNGDTQVFVGRKWRPLSQLAPALGKRRHLEGVLVGKFQPNERVSVNVVAGHQALLAPKPVLTNKGKPTGKTITAPTWVLVADLPPETGG